MTTNTISTETLRSLYDSCGGDLNKVAAELRIPYSEFVSRYAPAIAPATQAPAPRRPPPADAGHMLAPRQKHIVAVRHVDSGVWPQEYKAAIEKARRDYEAGTHEMVQGKDPRGWYVLYSIPRKKKTHERKFFHSWT